MSSVLERFNKIQADISKEAPNLEESAKIIAVSKTFTIDHIEPLINHGHIHFGENKVQEAEKKWQTVKNKNISPRLKKLKKVILLKSPYKKKPVAKSA